VRKISCIAIDDDVIFLSLIKNYIEKTEFLELLGAYDDPEKGVNALIELKPDLLFIDMYMNTTTGIEIIKNLTEKPKVVMITSSPDFAVDAYDLEVTDYLVKPIEGYMRFLKAANRVRNSFQTEKIANNTNEPLFFKVDSALVSVLPTDITLIQAYGDYVKVISKNKTYVVKNKIGSIEENLPDIFLRVHRSFIINIRHIDNIEQNTVRIAGQVIPVGQMFKDELLKRIKSV
jgi:DNA-binding LytR/AlgR family response regulator